MRFYRDVKLPLVFTSCLATTQRWHKSLHLSKTQHSSTQEVLVSKCCLPLKDPIYSLWPVSSACFYYACYMICCEALWIALCRIRCFKNTFVLPLSIASYVLLHMWDCHWSFKHSWQGNKIKIKKKCIPKMGSLFLYRCYSCAHHIV